MKFLFILLLIYPISSKTSNELIEYSIHNYFEKGYHEKYSNSDFGKTIQYTTDGGYVIISNIYKDKNYDCNFQIEHCTIDENEYNYNIIKIDSLGKEQWKRNSIDYLTSINVHQDVIFKEYVPNIKSIKQTSDNGFIMVGTIGEYMSYYIFLIKIDNNGNKEWHKQFGNTSSMIKENFGENVIETNDGGYAIIGSTLSYGFHYNKHHDIYIVKTDINGNEEWSKIYSGHDMRETVQDWGKDIIQTIDEGYIITGYKDGWINHGECDLGCPPSFGNYNVWLIKIDENGNRIWDKSYGKGGIEKGFYVKQTSDEGFILLGSIKSYDLNNTFTGFDISRVYSYMRANWKFDDTINERAVKFLANILNSTKLRSLAKKHYPPYEFAFAYHYTNSMADIIPFQYFLNEYSLIIKTDRKGNKEWIKTHPIKLTSAIESSNGDIILTSNDKEKTFLIRIDKNGNEKK